MEVVYDFVGENHVLPHGEPPFPVRADSIYKGENKMPEQNSITKNVKLKSGRQFAKCKALSSRLFLFNQQGRSLDARQVMTENL